MWALVLLVGTSPMAADDSHKEAALTPDECVAASGLSAREVAVGKTAISDRATTVGFKVERVFIPTGSQPPGTELPIGLVAKPLKEGSVPFSILLMGDIPGTLRRVGISQPEEHFVGRHVEVRGKVRKYPASPGVVGARPTYQVWVENLSDFQVVQ